VRSIEGKNKEALVFEEIKRIAENDSNIISLVETHLERRVNK
jgi:hypothetical protein